MCELVLVHPGSCNVQRPLLAGPLLQARHPTHLGRHKLVLAGVARPVALLVRQRGHLRAARVGGGRGFGRWAGAVQSWELMMNE